MPHFGPRILGKEKFDAQKKREKGGQAFGPRVRGDQMKSSTAIRPGQPRPPKDEGISVAEVVRTLKENATFCETLYMQELARPEGPRPEALQAIKTAAASMKKYDIAREIDSLLSPEIKTTETNAKPKTRTELLAMDYGDLIAHGQDRKSVV